MISMVARFARPGLLGLLDEVHLLTCKPCLAIKSTRKLFGKAFCELLLFKSSFV